MKKFHGFLRKYGMVIINFKTEKMKLLSNEQQTSYQVAKTVIFVKKNLKINMLKKNHRKVRTIVIIQGNIEWFS